MLGHENIFALGDVVDLPVQRSIIASHHQARCVGFNAVNYLKAQSLTGKYKLETSLPLYTGISKMNSYWSKEGKESIGMENFLKDSVTYLSGKNGAKGASKLYEGKKSGVGAVYELMNKFEKPEATGAQPKFASEN